MPDRRPCSPTAPPDGRAWFVLGAVAWAGFAVIALTVVLDGGPEGPGGFDVWGMARLSGLRTRSGTLLAQLVTVWGTVRAVVGSALLAAAGLWVRSRRLRSSVVLLGAVAATGSSVYLLKIAVGRLQPSVDDAIGGPSTDFSFPSGHTTDATVVYVLTALLVAETQRRRWWRRVLVPVAAAVALSIGVSRVYLGYHWPTDVLAGWFLAGGVITVAVLVHRMVPGPVDRPTAKLDQADAHRLTAGPRP